MAIELRKIGNVEAKALGYTHEATFSSSDLSTSTGAQATDVTLGGSQLAGLVLKGAIIVDQLVSADVTTGSAISDATIALGDDGDPNGFVVEVNCFTGDSSEGNIFANNGDLIAGAATYGHVVTAVDVTSNGTGNGFGNAQNGKFRLFLEYYPTAGEGFNS